MSAGDLVLLTAEYPFGNKSETFLETEIPVLAARFDRIFVLPSKRSEGIRPLPANVSLVEMEWLEPPSPGRKAASLLTTPAARVVAATLTAGRGLGGYARHPRRYLELLAINVLKAVALRRFIAARGLGAAIFYDYWFENSTLALALLRREGAVRCAVSRAHGFDVYDERWGGGPVPFRDAKAAGLDRVFVVSDFGRRYLAERIPDHADALRVAHLGVSAQEAANRAPEGRPHVVTCGSMIPSKRTHLVPRILTALGRPVRWTHFGDGPERGRVEAAAHALTPDVEWRLRGHVDNPEVLRFYRDNPVSALLSVSVSEGLPVSMMEAQSFGIPIVALGVHGVPEIVNAVTGVCLDPDAPSEEIAEALSGALDPTRFDRAGIRDHFARHFDAHTNYNAFADALIALRKSTNPAA